MWSILQQLEMLWAWTKMPLSGLVRVYAFIRVICGMCPGAKSPVTSSSLCFQPWSGYGQNGDEGVKISLILAAAKSMVLGCVGGSNAIIISQSICRVNQSPYLVSGRYLFWGQAGRDHWVVFAFMCRMCRMCCPFPSAFTSHHLITPWYWADCLLCAFNLACFFCCTSQLVAFGIRSYVRWRGWGVLHRQLYAGTAKVALLWITLP